MSGITDSYSIIACYLAGTEATLDIKEYVGAIEVYEDITRPFVSANLSIIDPHGLIEKVPIVGDEQVTLVIQARDANGAEAKAIALDFDVYSLEDVVDTKDRVKQYTLKLVTKSLIENQSKFCRKFYKGSADSVTSQILTAMFSGSLGASVTDPTKHDSEKYIFPTWHPFKCIKHMTQHSISKKYNDPNYFFFVNRDVIPHFVSMSWMIDQEVYSGTKTRKMRENYIDGESYVIHSIERINNFDVMTSHQNGLYGSSTIGHNLITKTITEVEKTFDGEWSSFTNLGGKPMTTKHGGNISRKVIRPISLPEHDGTYDHEIEDRDRLVIRNAMIDPIAFAVTVTGNPLIHIGKGIEFNVQSTLGIGSQEIDKLYSGKWLVKRIKHVFSGDKYIMALEVIKDSLE